MNTAKIREVHIAAAHDGEAELLVTLEYANGGRTQVTLDEFAAPHLLSSCQAETTGRPHRSRLGARARRPHRLF
jgi:hypothetical protein